MKFLKELRWNIIAMSVAYVALGVILILWPEATMTTICYVIAAGLLVTGIVSLIHYVSHEVEQVIYRHELVIGVSAVLGGILIIVKAEQITNLIPIVLGFVITISGILKLQNSVDLIRLGYGPWNVAFVLAVINIVAGIVLLINPFAKEMLLIIIGVFMVYSGLSDLYVTLAISKRLKDVKEQFDYIEKDEE